MQDILGATQPELTQNAYQIEYVSSPFLNNPHIKEVITNEVNNKWKKKMKIENKQNDHTYMWLHIQII